MVINIFFRYKTIDIDFLKLSNVLKNMADIYASQADFKNKMTKVHPQLGVKNIIPRNFWRRK